MNEYYNTEIRRRVGAERTMLMLPFNVVMVARIRGNVDENRLAKVLGQLRARHALLAVRVEFDEHDVAWYVTDGVPEFNLEVGPRQTADQWIERAEAEYKISFPLEVGPLVRFTLLHSPEVSELIVCGHHAVCDGLSLVYLIRDVLQHLGEPDRDVEILPEPPPIDKSTVPSPPSIKPVARKIIEMLNRKWAKKDIRFNSDEIQRLHRVFWDKNGNQKLLAWDMSEEMTTALVSRCREEKVTVNTALWTAFLAAQHGVQDAVKSHQHRSALAVNTRDKLTVPVGDAFGFYASSLTVQLKYTSQKSFWESARRLHKKIRTSLEKTDIFRMLMAELLSPTLLDSLYFSKYGLKENKMSNRLLKRMGWDRITYGFAITNVGRVDIPTDYGPLVLDAVYGPSFYSDVEEKIVGVITVGGRISFMLTHNEAIVSTDTANKIRDMAMSHLSEAVDLERR